MFSFKKEGIETQRDIGFVQEYVIYFLLKPFLFLICSVLENF